MRWTTGNGTGVERPWSSIARWGKARQHHDGVRLQHLQQGLGGAKDVKLLGRETDVLDQYRVHNAQHARVSQLHTTLQQFPRLRLELCAVSGLAILVISMLAQDRAARLLLDIWRRSRNVTSPGRNDATDAIDATPPPNGVVILPLLSEHSQANVGDTPFPRFTGSQ